MNLASDIIAYEMGELTEEETLDLFQALVDNGMAWRLQGSYGRMAMNLIQTGQITVTDSTPRIPRNRQTKSL